MKLKYYLISILFLSFSTSIYAKDKLIFAINIIRHGDRNPAVELPASPHHWPQGLGELTPTGMQQEYQLGQKLHKKYIEETHLLPEHYQAETMYVRATNFNRTIMSAESLLYGLYPLGSGPQLPNSHNPALPSGFQPIPIHTVPRTSDTLLLTDHNPYLSDALFALYVMTQKEWRTKTAALKDKFPLWSKQTGKPIHSLYQLAEISDNLYIRKLYHVPMPKGMSNEDADQIISVATWGFISAYKPYRVGRMTSGFLLKKINDYFLHAKAGSSPLKYVLFSAHDSTLMSVMSALGVPLNQQPHYASNLNFSLYRDAQNHDYIKTTFNDVPVHIPGCRTENCTIDEFDKITR